MKIDSLKIKEKKKKTFIKFNFDRVIKGARWKSGVYASPNARTVTKKNNEIWNK